MSFSPLFADLSNNNSGFDAARYRAADLILVALKATEGTFFTDGRHHEWTHQAHLHGIAVVHYHFDRADRSSGAAEAQAFVHFTRGYLGPHDYVAYDGERRKDGTFGLVVQHAHDFDAELQRLTRFHAWLYASASQLAGAKDALVGSNRRDWDANYSTAPDTHAPGHELVARQFTDGMIGPGPHALPGVGQADVNVMHGSVLHDVIANANAPKFAS